MRRVRSDPCTALTMSLRSRDLAAFVGLVFLVISAWSVGLPRLSGPDEWDHVARAASASRGHILPGPAIAGSNGQRVLTVPAVLVAADVACFAFKPSQTADCQPFEPVAGEVELASSTARYPPAFYLLTGSATLVRPSFATLWLARLVSAALCALLAGAALWLAASVSPWMGIAALGALTPMTLYVGSIVNPSGVEVMAAVLLWLTIARGTPDRAGRASAIVGASTLAVARPISFVWVLAIVAIAAAAWGGRRVVALFGRVLGPCVVGVTMVASLAWFAVSGVAGYTDARLARNESTGELVGELLGNIGWLGRQMVGVFGYLDTSLPAAMYWAWAIFIAALVVGGLFTGSGRLRIALVVVVVSTVLVPILADLQAARTLGFFWQGRYTLPLAVGIPVLAGAALSGRGVVISPVVVALVRGLVPMAHGAALYVAIRRFALGTTGSWRVWGSMPWSPPVPALIVVGIEIAAAAGVAFLLTVRCVARTRVVDTAQP